MIWDLNPRYLRIARWVGYPLAYLLALITFAYLTFPFERLKDRVVAEFNAAQADASGMRLEIDDVSWYFLTGVEAQGVRLISPPPATDSEGKPDRPQVFEIDDVSVHYSLWAHLTGGLRISFAMEAGGGELSGYVSDEDGSRIVSLQFDQMGISGIPFVAGAVGLPLSGALSGTVELVLPEAKLSKGNGSAQLAIVGLAVGDGKAKIRDTIALPRLDAGQLELALTVKDGHVKVEKLTASGPDLELASDGRIRLRDPLGTSRADLSLSFKFSDRYKTQNDMTKGLFGDPGSNIKGAFDLDPKNQQALRPDGFYAWRVTGPLAKLALQPARAAPGAAKSATSRSARRTRPNPRQAKPATAAPAAQP